MPGEERFPHQRERRRQKILGRPKSALFAEKKLERRGFSVVYPSPLPNRRTPVKSCAPVRLAGSATRLLLAAEMR